MNNYLLKTIFFSLFLFSINTIVGQKTPLSKKELNEKIEATIIETNEVFYWNNAEVHDVYSGLLLSDSIASIGYKPAHLNDINRNLHTINLNSQEWINAKNLIIDFIISKTTEKYGELYDRKYLFPLGTEKPGPYINARIFDLEIIELLKAMPQLRYFEVMGYSLIDENAKSGSGCGNYVSSINSNDYTSITPSSRQSWHHLDSNVDCAWPKTDQGKDIWVALMDTGVSPTNEKLNAQFNEGDSQGRTIEKYGFYAPNGTPDGWEDQCGHGTAMAGLIAAPRGFDDTPAGSAYNCNLVSYRVAEDVVINSSDEKDGLSNALYDVVNDARIHIISMSIGDVFYSSQVGDAIIAANNAGKLAIAAAGTSFTLTNWYGVIFPANMNETVAVTGIDDGSTRTRCSNCHSGGEVDFVVVMERENDTARKGITLGVPSLSQGYVGGSSNATATTAGIAALIWGQNDTWDKNQVLNRMILTADNYPTRDNNFGWGLIDACMAVDSVFGLPCTSNLSNEVTMEITNISFPPTFDAFTGEAEWVIDFNGDTHFFEVDVNGASGNPASFINTGICGFIPITVDLGTTTCGASSLTVNIESFEDDGVFSDCVFDSGDDDLTNTIETIDFNNTTFTHASSAGNFVFTYTLSCSPTATPAATMSGDTTMCENTGDYDLVFYGSGGTPPYTIDYQLNGAALPPLTTGTNNTDTIAVSSAVTGSFLYELVQVTDANGCTNLASGSSLIVIDPSIIAGLTQAGVACPGQTVNLTASPAGMDNYEFFHDVNNNGILDAGETLQSGPSDQYSSASFNNNDMIGVIVSSANSCEGMAFVTIAMSPSDYAGPNALTGTVNGIEDYETDGIIESNQLISPTAIVDYDSATEIELQIGFEVQIGATICIFIDGCNGGSGGVNLNGNEDSKKK